MVATDEEPAEEAEAGRLPLVWAFEDEEESLPNRCVSRSMGRGKIMVEFFSAEMELRVCKDSGDAIKLRL